MQGENLLAADGKPLFFSLGNFSELALPMPEIRLSDSVRLWARSLTVMQKEAVVASAKTGRAWRLASDEGAYLDGFDEAPCPLSFMTVGMAASFMNETAQLARGRGINPAGIRLTLDNFYTMKGSALKGTMIGGALNPQLRAECDGATTDAETLRAIVSEAAARATVNGLLRGGNCSLFSLSNNGEELRPDKSAALDFHLPDGTMQIEKASPAPGARTDIVAKTGMTEKTSEDTSAQGSSLRAEQDRRLHIRGVCTLLDDGGLKKIEQRLYNPRGSVFEFISDEAPENGGGGRAPDAHSYIAAGLGFCFMTQFGRYAKIVKKELSQYNIAQDIHFDSAGENVARAPAETHVYLKTPDGGDFARAALDMGERTCFLHALCRTDLQPEISAGVR